ncbi:MAG TPA: bifunctional [glutamate--ammonia ligase]-adenylyl-L-tyrosine phosphorylase/[glutamate--ammonia-ligase] adenylyltransferase [Burkholderiales bacterium]|nr:bifunctional [glutamate--ammonia ligase]-adenylyl-L-tyrosine phosphorylase/[glutamate--ammonia-ligase] adenylyltransferase [Burkholderiales bacterium]
MESPDTPAATAAPISPSSPASPYDRAACYSRYVRRIVAADSDLVRRVEFDRTWTGARMRERLAGLEKEGHPLTRSLRVLRKEVMLALIARDLSGLAALDEVVATVTALAEVALGAATDGVHRELAAQYGEPRGSSGALQKLHVVGMGKLGGGELNVSSDIDLILLYPEEGETDGARSLSNHEFFTRLARRLSGLLSERTEDGYVFRVDLRLRPYGDSGPVVASFDMLENYLVTQGREWERYAWIKGRVLTGDRGDELMELVRPFVFRRHLDFSAFESMRDLHRQIRVEVERRDIADNIKLGPGGIREIEFIVQLFQLIRGGRDAPLRRQPTLAVLPLLAEKRLLAAEAVAELTAAYVFLRNLEHRLQYLDDAQTHALPRAPEDRELVAQSMGFGDYASLRAALERHRDTVTRHFNDTFVASSSGTDDLASVWHDAPAGSEAAGVSAPLAKLGFSNPAEVQRRLAAFRDGSRFRQMPAASQARIGRLMPRVLETAAAQEKRDETFERMLQLLESISRRESYLALLEQYPQALARVAELMGASPWAAQYLTQHPILLDELLDVRTLYEAPDWPTLTTAVRREIADADGDVEKQMDLLRHFKHVQTMRLLAQDLAGTLRLETLSDDLSDLACHILEIVVELAWAGVPHRHREKPAFAVVGYGKLGGKELGYASDLDIVFLYDDAAPEAPEAYARLARRISHWLTSMTSAGILYEIDLRLRPDGASGLLVSPLQSFRDYQMKHAWPWEHQALTRARFAAGDRAIGEAFEAIRIDILREQRDLAALRTAVLDMRRKMLDAHPNTSGLFDLKHDRGGIIDVEFIVQYLVLGHSHEHEELTKNLGNLALLKIAARLGLIPEDAALAAHDAYHRFRQLQHALRLQGERYARIAPEAARGEAQAVRALWSLALGDSPATP